jgi:hypothetical protein
MRRMSKTTQERRCALGHREPSIGSAAPAGGCVPSALGRVRRRGRMGHRDGALEEGEARAGRGGGAGRPWRHAAGRGRAGRARGSHWRAAWRALARAWRSRGTGMPRRSEAARLQAGRQGCGGCGSSWLAWAAAHSAFWRGRSVEAGHSCRASGQWIGGALRSGLGGRAWRRALRGSQLPPCVFGVFMRFFAHPKAGVCFLVPR